jgi:hypothetical protein
MLCTTTPIARVERISAAFPVKTVKPTEMLEEPWAKAFRVYVAQSDGQEEGASVTRDQVTSKDAEKDKADALRKQGRQVIEAGWTCAGRQAARLLHLSISLSRWSASAPGICPRLNLPLTRRTENDSLLGA